MKRLLVLLLLASPAFAGSRDFTLHAPYVPEPRIVEALPPDPQTHTFPALDTNNNFSGINTFLNLNDILWVGAGAGSYNTVAAAVTAAGSVNKTIIGIRSTFAGTCPAATLYSTNPNITVWDFSGLCNPTTPSAAYQGTSYNFSDGNVLAMQRHGFTYSNFPGTNLALVTHYAITATNNFTVGSGNTVDGISAEADTFGTFSGTLLGLQAAEHSVTVGGTGVGTITNATAVLGYVNMTSGHTTTVTNVRGLWGRGYFSNAGPQPINAYGGYFDDQTSGGVGKASGRNYSWASEGISLLMYSGGLARGGLDCEDAAHATHFCLYTDVNSALNLQMVNDTGGINFNRTNGVLQAQLIPNAFRFGVNVVPTVNAAVQFGTNALGWSAFYLGETTAPSAAANEDACYGDSTAHSILCSWNNDAFGALAKVNKAATWTAAQTNMPLTTPTLTGVTNGTGLQLFNTATTCTTAASVGAICTTAAITLPVAYADTNYRLSCTGITPTNVPIVETYTKSNTTFTLTIAALTAAAATFTSYDCSAKHN